MTTLTPYSVNSPTVAVTLTANTAVLIAVPSQGSFTYSTVTVNTTGVAWLLGGSTSSVTAASGVSTQTGAIATHGSITGGSSYTTGTYTGVHLTGGSGTGAIATIVVAAGAVTTVTITNGGLGYKASDTGLTTAAANIGGTGSGFAVAVSTITYAGILTSTSLYLPAAGSFQIGVASLPFISVISTGTPTISFTFS